MYALGHSSEILAFLYILATLARVRSTSWLKYVTTVTHTHKRSMTCQWVTMTTLFISGSRTLNRYTICNAICTLKKHDILKSGPAHDTLGGGGLSLGLGKIEGGFRTSYNKIQGGACYFSDSEGVEGLWHFKGGGCEEPLAPWRWPWFKV